jgi:aspartate/tyrosine/aromatic aminotransferase
MAGRTAEREAMNDVINISSTQLSQVIRQDGIMTIVTVSLLPVQNLNERTNICLNKTGRLLIDYIRPTLK